MILAKEFYFSAAHRNLYDDSIMRNLHGHKFRIRICLEDEAEVEGPKLDDVARDIEAWIALKLDHGTIVAADDSLLRSFVVISDSRYFVMTRQPTVKNMTDEILQALKKQFENETVKITRFAIND